MTKKIIALILAILMVFVLVGCNKNKRQIVKLTLSTEDAEAILAAAGITLPDAETVSAAGSTVTYYSWHDPFHNYAEDEIINTGFFTFTEKYGCDVEWYECDWGERFSGLANLVLSGNSPDFYPGYAESFPTYYLKGVFQSVDEYVDYTDPLWAGTSDFAHKYFSLGDKCYMIVTDVTFNAVCAYNRRVIDEWGFDDPAELYYNDEWTWDVFYEMCMEFSDPDEDRFALDGWACSQSFITSCGTTVIALDADQAKFVSNLDDPRLERAATLLYDLTKNECSYPMWDRGFSPILRRRASWSIRFPRAADRSERRSLSVILLFVRFLFPFFSPSHDFTDRLRRQYAVPLRRQGAPRPEDLSSGDDQRVSRGNRRARPQPSGDRRAVYPAVQQDVRRRVRVCHG